MEEESPPPSLRIIILQGPRKGETLDFKPRSAIRIGRVIRGNTLPIKDPGISTKHLSILTESSNWILRDLDSSNGTVLDGINVVPNTPYHIRDGSNIKIGETTSILVSFLQPQQNPTRTTRTGSVTFVEPVREIEEEVVVPVVKPVRGRRGKGLKCIDENASVNDGDESGQNPNRIESVTFAEPVHETEEVVAPVAKPVRGRRGKGLKCIDENASVNDADEGGQNPSRGNRTGLDTFVEPVHETEEEVTVPVAKPVRGRRGKGLKCIDENASVNDGEESGYVDQPVSRRVTRNSKNTRAVSDTSAGNLDAPEKVEGPKNMRVTRNLRKKQSVIEVCGSSIGNSDALEEKVEEEPKKNTRVTRNSKNKVSEVDENLNLEHGVENLEKKKTRGGAKGKKKLQEERVDVGEGGNNENCDDEPERGDLNGDENVPDLEKMNLGEWFDFLEVHLPKQIIDATEEMFDSMRHKAERLREYITVQENNKLQVPPE